LSTTRFSIASARRRSPARVAGAGLGMGLLVSYLSLVVLIPLAALVWRAASGGGESFWAAISRPESIAALKLTLLLSFAVTIINAIVGTLIAWVLVRDRFRGWRVVDALIDLPFALPTIVAGLTLLALYGPNSPVGVHLAYTAGGVMAALAFVTLPFSVRSVQPLIEEADREMEEAASSLGAGGATTFRRVILPNLLPGILTGAGLGFAKAIGEFGSVTLISGNIPFHTEVSSVYIFGLIESDEAGAAAAVSVLLLGISLVVLLSLAFFQRWLGRHADG
jgi:sulfate transport system permease protein